MMGLISLGLSIKHIDQLTLVKIQLRFLYWVCWEDANLDEL